MASTAQAKALTEANRLAQARLGADTVRQSLAAWEMLDLNGIDATLRPWLSLMRAIIDAQRAKSAALAGNYLTAFRALELGLADFSPAFVTAIDPNIVTTSMTVTGPIRFRAAIGVGKQATQAADLARTSNANAAVRHALNAGRETIITNVGTDTKAVGWARTTSGKPCAFCAMLASRGPVFKGHSFDKTDPRFSGHGKAKVHDGCHCNVEPVYRDDADWPTGSRRFGEIWRDSTRGLSGDDATNAFRQALNA